jgi:hypothetical protein
MAARRRTSTRSGHEGIALLFAMLVAALALSLGLAIMNIAYKELELSSIASQSQRAFFAADTGWECAMYHDFNDNAVFDRSQPEDVDVIRCAGEDRELQHTELSDDRDRWRFKIDSNDICSAVTVIKEGDVPAETSIEADGFNTCQSARQQVQRTILVNY